MIAKMLTILLFSAFTGLNAWAGPGIPALTSLLFNSVRRMGLATSNLPPQNARILADGIENLSVNIGDDRTKRRLLGLLRKDGAVTNDWSTEDANDLARLVHGYAEPRPRNRLFPQVTRNAEGKEIVSLRTIWNPDIAEVARNVPWTKREELVGILEREVPKMGFSKPSRQSLDGVSDERLGIAALIAIMVARRSDGSSFQNFNLDRALYGARLSRDFFHTEYSADINYIEETVIFERPYNLSIHTPVGPQASGNLTTMMEVMREDLVRDIVEMHRRFRTSPFSLEDFWAHFAGHSGHYEGYDPETSLHMVIRLDLADVTLTED